MSLDCILKELYELVWYGIATVTCTRTVSTSGSKVWNALPAELCAPEFPIEGFKKQIEELPVYVT